MTLARVVDGFSAFLAPVVAPADVGSTFPATPSDLPAVTLSLDLITHGLTSIGALPSPSRTGALPIQQDFDLADPTLTFPDGETVDLLSGDRLRLHFPYGPVVAAGGEEVVALAPADLTVDVDGSGRTVVAGAPGATQVQGVPALGEIIFGAALPNTGLLHIEFFVGEWEVDTARYQGQLTVDASAGNAADVADLTEAVIGVLHDADFQDIPGLHSLRPIRLGPIVALDGVASARTQSFAYSFDFEVERPTLGTGGGIIGLVDVDSFLDDALGPPIGPEEFEVVQ